MATVLCVQFDLKTAAVFLETECILKQLCKAKKTDVRGPTGSSTQEADEASRLKFSPTGERNYI